MEDPLACPAHLGRGDGGWCPVGRGRQPQPVDVGLTTVEIGLVFGPFCIGAGAILVFATWCANGIPAAEPLECECRPPIIVRTYRAGVEYWCGGCASRWIVEMDLTRTRQDYLYWRRLTPLPALRRPAVVPASPDPSSDPLRVREVPALGHDGAGSTDIFYPLTFPFPPPADLPVLWEPDHVPILRQAALRMDLPPVPRPDF
jgi:hypothetical protein